MNYYFSIIAIIYIKDSTKYVLFCPSASGLLLTLYRFLSQAKIRPLMRAWIFDWSSLLEDLVIIGILLVPGKLAHANIGYTAR